MKDIRVGDKLEFKITKITKGLDNKIYVEIKNDMFEKTVEVSIREDKFVWKSENGRVTIR